MCILRWGWCAHSTTTSFKLLLLGTKEISFSYICSNHGRGALAPWAEPTPRVLTSPAKRGARPQFFMRWHDCMVHGKTMSSLRLGTLGARHPPQSPQLATKESTTEEHRRRMKRQGAHRQFFIKRHDCMVHGKAMSSLKLGTLGARPPSQSPQLAAKESTMEEHRR